MTCGINLGSLLVCFLTPHVCSSWALHEDKSSWTDNTNSPGVHGRFKGSSPQDEFRQAYVVRGSSTDTGAKWGLYGRKHSALQAKQNAYTSVQYYQSSRFPNGNVSPKQVFGQSSSMAGSSVSDSFNQYNGQQGTKRTNQYAPSKPDLPTRFTHQPSAWKPPNTGNVHEKPDLATGAQLTGFIRNGGLKPKEYMKSTSGLAHGKKVNQKTGSIQHASSHFYNPVISKIHERYELPISHYFGLHQSHQVSAYNQNPQFTSLQIGSNLGRVPIGQEFQRETPGVGEKVGSSIVHIIPWSYGGHPIKRARDEEPMDQTTTTEMPKKPVTRLPTKTYPFPPRHTESQRPPQSSAHKKSKWIRIRSNQLAGSGALL